ncbi:hypothetical protein DE146DRAFT_670487 [Phaeosphaeria sp. MPI-PUGE-AT-0046c]|nr:hypothetical protein DE146DRAFT_670487 [Phaeosphaeria sp. MPI-PUGE-AT-0046c]
MEKNVATAQAEKLPNGQPDLDTVDLAALAIDKTALNAIRSPLLRLPAEIRQQIWSLHISDLVINVDSPNRPRSPVGAEQVWDPALGYYVYQLLPQVPYHLTFSTCGPLIHTICNHIGPRYSRRPHPWDACEHAPRVFHPLVCKQFWFETHDMFIGRATWVFHHHQDLVLFIKTKKHALPHIRRLVVRSAHNPCVASLGNWVDSWQQALTWSNMRHFRRLQGVELHITVPYWESAFHMLRNPRHDPLRNNAKLKAVLRSLQQHKLQPDITRVKMYPRNLEGVQLKGWEAAWRDVLLTHVPLGQGESGKEKKWARKHLKNEGEKV